MKRRVFPILRDFRAFLRISASSKSSLFGLITVTGYVSMATVGPFLVPLDLVGRSARYLPPSLEHLFGTDYIGRDIFGQIVHGSRDVLLLAFAAAMMTIIISVILGTVAGMKGGRVDTLLTFITDVMLTIPGFPLLIVIAASIKGGSILVFAGALAIVSWAGPARAIRSQVLSLKRRDFVEASRSAGFNTLYIIFFDIIPLILPYVAVNTLLIMIGAIYSLVGLALIGAIPWSECNWGVMINIAVNYAGALTDPRSLQYLLAPLLAIAILQISLIMLSHTVEVVFNPRLRET